MITWWSIREKSINQRMSEATDALHKAQATGNSQKIYQANLNLLNVMRDIKMEGVTPGPKALGFMYNNGPRWKQVDDINSWYQNSVNAINQIRQNNS